MDVHWLLSYQPRTLGTHLSKKKLTHLVAFAILAVLLCECELKYRYDVENRMRYRKVPDETIRRLPVYLRALTLHARRHSSHISSQQLSEFVGVNPWQIRKDFSYFGEFGKPGVGYNIAKLAEHIKRILKLNTLQKIALVGVGNLGSAILSYPGFAAFGFTIAAAFDTNPKLIGKKVKGILVEDARNLSSLRRRNIRLAVIAVPAEAAQQTADALVDAGIKAILNFAPTYVTVPKRVKVITLDIAMELARLPFYVPAG